VRDTFFAFKKSKGGYSMKRISYLVLICLFLLSFSGISFATNGDNLMAIGPIARAMGGVGVAAPQDAISAVFANPAAMCFGPYCPGTEVNFGGTLFMPKVDASVTLGDGNAFSADSARKVYAIPAIGLSVPITNNWRFGLAAYGVSGLGVDYRDTALDNPTFFDFGPMGRGPLVQGAYTQLQVMKFSPSISYQINNSLSLGLGVHIDYSNLDLRNGSSSNYGFGAQLGAIYKASDMITLGATYVTPQGVDHQNVVGTPEGSKDLKLQSPQQVGVGISVEPIKNTLLVEVNGRWINWGAATGYADFDWKDQWVFALGVQYKPTKQLALRAGYNYANNPVREHDNFAGTNVTFVQGIPFPTYYYETFRIIGFPAVAEQHISFGIGYELSNKFALNAGYTHAFEHSISESGTTPTGVPVSLKSTLSEDSIELGFTWRF
jgi:long-chain fatty acid transport protein